MTPVSVHYNWKSENKNRNFEMPIKIGIRRKIEIILNATEFLTNWNLFWFNQNHRKWVNFWKFWFLSNYPWNSGYKWFPEEIPENFQLNIRYEIPLKFVSRIFDQFSLNSLKFGENVDSACLFVFMCKQNFNLWSTTFNFRNGRYNLSYFLKIIMSSSAKPAILNKNYSKRSYSFSSF